MHKLYRILASTINARENCRKSGKTEWLGLHEQRILALVKQYLPSGSGFDSGTSIDLDASTDDKLVLCTAYHHMNDGGFYDGWTKHTVTVRPSLVFGFRLTISGRDRNEIKDYMHDCFHTALSAEIDESTKLAAA